MLKKILLSLIGINLVIASTISYAQNKSVEYTNEITDEQGTHYVSPAVPVPVDPATIPHVQYVSVTENKLHNCKPQTEQAKEILEQFILWNAALWTENPKEVAKLYAKRAILLPTLSNKVRHTPAEIEDYFVHFLQKQPQGKLLECNIRVFDNVAINSGVYRFFLKDKKHETAVDARYTYVYQRQENGSWLIIEHHSSLMPEKETKTSKEEHAKKSEKSSHKASSGHHH